jgi:hypothetical protein
MWHALLPWKSFEEGEGRVAFDRRQVYPPAVTNKAEVKGRRAANATLANFTRPICLPAVVLARTAAAVATASATTTAGSAVGFRTSFIDVQRPAVQVGAIERRDGLIRLRPVTHFNESKSSSLPGVPVGDDADTVNGAVCFKHGSNRIFGSTEAEVSYKNIFHFLYLSEVREQWIEAGSDKGGWAGLSKDAKNYALRNDIPIVTRNGSRCNR